MHEDHHREQYFFDPPTAEFFAAELSRYDRVACLCAPKVAEALEARGRSPRLLEVDDRFASLRGYVRWDLYRPRPLDEVFDAVFVDPPFTKVSLAQLFAALRVLTRGEFTRPLYVCHLASREADVVGALGLFELASTGYEPGYVTVRPTEENRVLLYANVPLAAGHSSS